MITLGIKSALHDTSAAIVIDGKILAASEEERFDRKKHSGKFPINSIQFCLQEAKIQNINDVDEIAIGMKWKERGLARFNLRSSYKSPELTKFSAKLSEVDKKHEIEVESIMRDKFGYKGPIKFLDHHDCHASSCFFTSNFSSSAIIIIDGAGEVASSRTYKADGKRFRKLLQIDYPNSLGKFYGIITDYLGFNMECDEGKVMALAAYGSDKLVKKMREILKINEDGTYRLDLSYFDFPKRSGAGVSEKFIDSFGPKRLPNEKIIQQHKDVAKAAQIIFEEAVISLVKLAKKLTKEESLCIAGGATLNSVSNGKIVDSKIFKNIYIYPAAGDDGVSVGAALYSYYLHNNERMFSEENQNPFLGYRETQKEIVDVIKKYNLPYKKCENIYKDVVQLIIQNKIVGWYSGRTEFGPRALGNRSIIADPREVNNRDLLNSKIKKREYFRPFAPTVLEEHAEEYFETQGLSMPYMIVAVNTRKEKRNTIPAVVHVDGTARIQTVNKKQNKRFWNLINEFYKITGIPMILNTSFNRRGEPIVNKPSEAIECFLNSGMDALVLEDFLIFK